MPPHVLGEAAHPRDRVVAKVRHEDAGGEVVKTATFRGPVEDTAAAREHCLRWRVGPERAALELAAAIAEGIRGRLVGMGWHACHCTGPHGANISDYGPRVHTSKPYRTSGCSLPGRESTMPPWESLIVTIPPGLPRWCASRIASRACTAAT